MSTKFIWGVSSDVTSCYEYRPSLCNTEYNNNLMESIYKEYEEKAKKAKLNVIARENFLIIDMVVNNKDLVDIYKSIKTANCDKIVIIPFIISYDSAFSELFNQQTFFLNSIAINDGIFGKVVSIQESIFFDNVCCKRCFFEGGANFSKTIFCGQVDFEGSDFKYKASFFESIFKDNVNFAYTSFEDKVYFTNATFHGKLDLEKSNTTGGLWLQDIYLESFIYTNGSSFDKLILEKINFFDNNPNNPIRFDEYFKNLKKTPGFTDRLESLRFTFNLLKSTYTQNYNHIEANNFYALEMLVRNKELSIDTNILEKLVFHVNEVTSNHGQSMHYPIFFIMCLASIWGLGMNNIDYFFSIVLPITDLINMDLYKEIGTCVWWVEIPLKTLYVFSKMFSAVLWWQLIRAIRKDIKH